MRNYNVALIVSGLMFQVAEAETVAGEETNTPTVSREDFESSLGDNENKDVLLTAFDSGDIQVEATEVSRNVEGKGKVAKPYLRILATSLDGALAIVGGKESDVWDKFNVGFDMGVRSTLGQQIIRENEGPEKYIGTAVKALMKVMPFLSETAALEIIKTQMQNAANQAGGANTEAAE